MFHLKRRVSNYSLFFTIDKKYIKYIIMKKLFKLLPFAITGRITALIIYFTLIIDKLVTKLES